MQNDQEQFADNAAPFNTIKLISAGFHDGCLKKHVIDIAASNSAEQKEYQLIAQSTKSVTIVKQKQYVIRSTAISNDTHTLFVANEIGIITQFQKEDSSLNYYPVRTFKVHMYGITSISLSNSKMHLLSASKDNILRVWDLENGTQLACLNEEQKEYQSQFLSCCWNDQDTLFASGDCFGGVVVWSPPLSIYNTSNLFIPLCEFKDEITFGMHINLRCLKFQENGLDLFASDTRVIRLWSINEKALLDSKSTHQQNAALPLIRQPKRRSMKLVETIKSFDVRGSKLVFAVEKEILSLSANSLQWMANAMKFEKVHNNYIHSLMFSKDGKYVASGSEDGSLAISDSKSGKLLKYIKNVHSEFVKIQVFEI